MSSVVSLRSFVGASASRLLVMVDLQRGNYDDLARDDTHDLARSLKNCVCAIQHARAMGMPIAFTRRVIRAGSAGTAQPSSWIAGFEPKRSDMVFESSQASCFTNRLFDDVVSRIGGFAIAGLMAEQACLATAIDAFHRGHPVTFLSDASACLRRDNADARAVHHLTTNVMRLFADPIATRLWMDATSRGAVKRRDHG